MKLNGQTQRSKLNANSTVIPNSTQTQRHNMYRAGAERGARAGVERSMSAAHAAPAALMLPLHMRHKAP
eukprot:6838700-Heterocapsa_arctica.AAC.1